MPPCTVTIYTPPILQIPWWYLWHMARHSVPITHLPKIPKHHSWHQTYHYRPPPDHRVPWHPRLQTPFTRWHLYPIHQSFLNPQIHTNSSIEILSILPTPSNPSSVPSTSVSNVFPQPFRTFGKLPPHSFMYFFVLSTRGYRLPNLLRIKRVIWHNYKPSSPIPTPPEN